MDRAAKLLTILVAISIIVPPVFLWYLWNDGAEPVDLVIQGLFLCSLLPLVFVGAYMWATGKGASLISGYNTAPRALQKMYDPQALARFVGMLLTVSLPLMLAALESIFLADNMLLFWALLAASIAVLIGGIVYANTGGRFLKEGVSKEDLAKATAEAKKGNRDILLALGVISGIMITFVVIILVLVAPAGSVNAALEDDGLQIEAPAANRDIAYGDITDVELRQSFDPGRRVGGFGGSEVSSGNFRNEEFGRYVLAQYNDIPEHIVVHHSGGVLVFNLDSSERTIQFCEDLRSRLA